MGQVNEQTHQGLVLGKFPNAFVRTRFDIFEVCVPLSRSSPRELRILQHYTHEEVGILGLSTTELSAWEAAAKETGVAQDFLCVWCREPYTQKDSRYVHGQHGVW